MRHRMFLAMLLQLTIAGCSTWGEQRVGEHGPMTDEIRDRIRKSRANEQQKRNRETDVPADPSSK